MAKLGSFRKQAWSTAGALNPSALNFGVAGLFALAAGIVWYAVTSSPAWVSKLAR